MSSEMIVMLQWLVIVVIGSLYYAPIGRSIAGYLNLSLLAANITAYLALVIVIKFLFTWIRGLIGEKLMASDLFGNSEYYLGIMAGMVRYAAVLVVVLAVLNARLITSEQLAATAKVQQDNFGDIKFPTFGSMQYDVFKRSVSGPFIRKHLSAQLIEPTPADKMLNSKEGIKSRRQRELDESFGSTR